MDPVLSRLDGAFENTYDGSLSVGNDVDPLLCVDRADQDFRAFITDLGWSPAAQCMGLPAAHTAELSVGPSYPVPCAGTMPHEEGLTALQAVGPRRSSGSTPRKRKSGSVGDLDQLQQPPRIQARMHWDTDSDDSEVRRFATPTAAVSQMPASPSLQIQTTPLKRSLSATGALTLTPFSLVKGQQSVSLMDINRRMQFYAEADAASTPQSSPGLASPGLRSTGRPHIRVRNEGGKDIIFLQPATRSDF